MEEKDHTADLADQKKIEPEHSFLGRLRHGYAMSLIDREDCQNKAMSLSPFNVGSPALNDIAKGIDKLCATEALGGRTFADIPVTRIKHFTHYQNELSQFDKAFRQSEHKRSIDSIMNHYVTVHPEFVSDDFASVEYNEKQDAIRIVWAMQSNKRARLEEENSSE